MYICIYIYIYIHIHVVLAAALKSGFVYVSMQGDWKRILLASPSVAGLHAFGVAPLWDNVWLTALF